MWGSMCCPAEPCGASCWRRCVRRTRRVGRIDRRGQIPHMTPIAERPAEVATRTVPGHWEDDLIKGARNGSAVGTLVERTTRLVLLARMEGTDATSARQGFIKTLRHVPALLRKTLTYDRGKERAEHERLAHRLAIQIFFADPYSPWQRGPNENTNGLLRQYLLTGTDLSGHVARVERHRASVEHAPEEMSRLCHAPGSLCATAPSFTRCTCTRCTWNLKPPILYPFISAPSAADKVFFLPATPFQSLSVLGIVPRSGPF
jgi:transposase InsO family protein